MDRREFRELDSNGEKPSPRFSCCMEMTGIKYDNEQCLLAFGGKESEFCSMELHFLKILSFNRKNKAKCKKNKVKTDEEKRVEEEDLNYIFEMHKRNYKLKDDLLSEKVKHVEFLKERAVVQRELLELQSVNDLTLQHKEEQLNRLATENSQKLSVVESKLELLSFEELRQQIRQKRQILLQDQFQALFEYPMSLYKLVTHAVLNKGKETAKDKDLKAHLEQQLPQIKVTRDKLINNIAGAKRVINEFNEIQEKLNTEAKVLETDIVKQFPVFEQFRSQFAEDNKLT